jgi:hypothetical protein
MSDPSNMNWQLGAARSVPRPEFSDSRPLQRQAVGSISSGPLDPAGIGTGAYVNAASRRPSRRRGGGSGLSAPGSPEGPDLGLYGGAADEIIAASGLGQQKYASSNNSSSSQDDDDLSPAERMSDADGPRPATGNMGDPSNPHALLTRVRARLGGLGTDFFAGE